MPAIQTPSAVPPSTQASSVQTYDVIILGAGAAGLLCAIEAGRRNRRTLLLDHADKAGKKILISGGGRCNFTNLQTRPENFLSANPHFAKSALARYTPADFLALVQQHNIAYHEKTLGQLFCDRSAHDIVTMLERECAQANVQTLLGVRVHSVLEVAAKAIAGKGIGAANATPGTVTASIPCPSPRFRVDTSAGPFQAHSVVVATGGLSIPKMGATSLGYTLAEQFGHTLIPCRPALVPLLFSPADRDRWCDLAGLSAEILASVNAPFPPSAELSLVPTNSGQNSNTKAATRRSQTSRTPTPAFREKLLITHRGLSGPATLQASSYWHPGQLIQIDLAPGLQVSAPLLAPRSTRDASAAIQALRAFLPARFAERWLALHPPPDWTNTGLAAFEHQLHTWAITPAGTEGYEKAEVTAGGVNTAELDAATLQSKRHPGLYFIGEVVDVTGWLGGYNFQWAWASGAAAGRSL